MPTIKSTVLNPTTRKLGGLTAAELASGGKRPALEVLSKKELVALAKARGLPHSGTMAELIERLANV